jgi:hypothetical protein
MDTHEEDVFSNEDFLPDIDVVTQHTTACCSIQVVNITLVKYQFTNITSLRVVQ